MRDLKKNNEIPNVPHLRFGEEEWTYISLGSISSKFDYGLNEEAIDYDGKHKYIRITDIDEITSKFINDNLTTPANFDNKYIVNKNDILLARTGASTGKSYLYDPNDGQLYFAGFLIRINVNYDINSIFVFNQLKTIRYKKWVKIISNRSGQPGINAEEYKTYKIGICSKATQDKIASFLSLIDNRIETQMKIIEEYKSLIKGIREKEFDNPCELVKLSEIAIYEDKTHHLSNNGLDFGRFPFFTNEEKNHKYFNSFDFDGEYIIANTGGKANFKYYNGKFAVMSDCLVIRIKERKDTYYYFNILKKLQNIINYVGFEGSGLKHLNKDWLYALKIPKNTNKNYTKIISTIEKNMQINIQILNKLINYKKFMINNLFI